ncbi:MAG: UDP-N-acetylmuramate--L-alanine ligase, partial [Tannerella sp.]|nr:UDP-N-acetylmuramate--L-alanine ligase [Tannerella sp.]
MKLEEIKSIYFIGAGGIGMSALIRYFLAKGKRVAGYDRTPSPLTNLIAEEGAPIHYIEDVSLIPLEFRDRATTLAVYTPAVPPEHKELQYFRSEGFEVLKRSQILGLITESALGVCVAGTHGKTTTSSMTAHLLKQSHVDCNAFLGGILKNYNSNLMLSDSSDLTVIEADEYDRSFHYLSPYMAIVTAADPDHLDIYGTAEAYRESFEKFTSLIRPGGLLLMKRGIAMTPRLKDGVRLATYSISDPEADYRADNIRIGNGEIYFDFCSPEGCIRDIQLGVPVRINVENAVAAIAIAQLCGVGEDEIRQAMRTFKGAERRFDFQIKTDRIVYLDDYAHHPQELESSILSVRELYAGRRLTGVFQPHLYTRTRDFADEFAKALSLLDRLILLDIYPAREEPIPGITSEMILEKVTIADKTLCHKDELMQLLA